MRGVVWTFVASCLFAMPVAHALTIEDAVTQCKKIASTSRENECIAYVTNDRNVCSKAEDKKFCEAMVKYLRPEGQSSRCSGVGETASSFSGDGLQWCTALTKRNETLCTKAFEESAAVNDCKAAVAALEIMDNALLALSSSESTEGSEEEDEQEVEPTTVVPTAIIVGFGTVKMAQTSSGTLEHIVGWKSSTGDLADLGNVRTRESVSWVGAPAEFGAASEYQSNGSHNGLGSTLASSGKGTDNHSIIPTGFIYKDPPNGTSATWKMTQVYQYSVNNGPWLDIPGSRYEITRWFENQDGTLVAYLAKRGLDDSKMQRSMVSVPKYFD